MRPIYRSTVGLIALLLVLVAAGNVLGAGLHPQQSALASVSAQAPTGTGHEVPDGTRKLPPTPGNVKPSNPNPNDHPNVCAAAVVNVSQTAGNQSESFLVVNPTNTNNLVAFSNVENGNNIFRGYSMNGGTTWTRGTVATGAACCDGQAVFDSFGNLFLIYINGSVNQINLLTSTDGGVTFGSPLTVGTGSVDQPSIAVGNGSVWVDWNSGGNMVARGAPVIGLGALGAFGALQTIPTATGSFGGIAVGPGPNGGKVMVTYQNPTGGEGPATIYANVDADGLGAGGFGARITVSTTNVGGFDFIPAQSGRSIDAEAGLVWDSTGGAFNNRVYLIYTEEPVNESNDTEIYVRTSVNDGATWTAPVRVNDDPMGPIRSQFLPYIALDPTSGTVAAGWHDARNDNGVPGVGGTNSTPNDDAEYYASYSTDGGVTWATNTRLSGGFSNAVDANDGVDYGDYVGQSAYGGKFYAMWADNANCDGTNPDGTLSRFDLYMGTLNIPGGGGSPTPTRTAGVTTPTRTATNTVVPTATNTVLPTSTSTATASRTATRTNTVVATNTSTTQPTNTATVLATATRTATSLTTSTATRTNTVVPPTSTNTRVATSTATSAASATATAITTSAATSTLAPTANATSTACTITFTDVPTDNPFYTFIRCLACRNIISGYGDGSFRPGNDITRGQIAKMVSNAAGFEEDPGPQVYEDVDSTNPFYQWINRLSNRGFIGGYPCGTIDPEPCVPPGNLPYFRTFADTTRGQLSKIVANAAGVGGTPTGLYYTDVPEDNPFYLWIMRLTNLGVMSGYDCGGPGEPCDDQQRPYFRPFTNVTRGQASKIVANTFFPDCQTPSR